MPDGLDCSHCHGDEINHHRRVQHRATPPPVAVSEIQLAAAVSPLTSRRWSLI
jgi:hypothetical protein